MSTYGEEREGGGKGREGKGEGNVLKHEAEGDSAATARHERGTGVKSDETAAEEVMRLKNETREQSWEDLIDTTDSKSNGMFQDGVAKPGHSMATYYQHKTHVQHRYNPRPLCLSGGGSETSQQFDKASPAPGAPERGLGTRAVAEVTRRFAQKLTRGGGGSSLDRSSSRALPQGGRGMPNLPADRRHVSRRARLTVAGRHRHAWGSCFLAGGANEVSCRTPFTENQRSRCEN